MGWGGCPRRVFTPLPAWITLAHEPSRLLGHQKERKQKDWQQILEVDTELA